MPIRVAKTFKRGPILLSAVGFLALVGCDENGEFAFPTLETGGDTASAATPSAPQVTLVERDVEAPDVFSVNDNGLWDGRPSLGGVWVAHPDVADPERVLIRNDGNGESVIGALFRRERDNPGPVLQVSSDAAEALGMLAGSPARLNVVALRREEGPAEPTVEVATEILEEPPVIEATPLDEVAAAPVEIAAAPTAAADSSTRSAGDVASSLLPVATPTATPTEDPIETTADPVLGAAAIAIAAAEAAATRDPVEETPTAAPVSTLEKPFIQIGIFSIESNATRTSELLRGNGLLATVLSQESQGRAFWRVIVGPAPSASDRAAVLDKAKSLGFTDAYAVTN